VDPNPVLLPEPNLVLDQVDPPTDDALPNIGRLVEEGLPNTACPRADILPKAETLLVASVGVVTTAALSSALSGFPPSFARLLVLTGAAAPSATVYATARVQKTGGRGCERGEWQARTARA